MTSGGVWEKTAGPFDLPAELAHVWRIRLPDVDTRSATRRILCHYLHCDADAITMEVGEFGKPFLASPHEQLSFNLSHSGSFALLALRMLTPVGVDIERWNDSVDISGISARFFTRSERAELISPKSPRRRERFYAIWTRKEAYLKALGTGVSRGLDGFSVSTDPDASVSSIMDPRQKQEWTARNIPVGPNYSASLVTVSPLRAVRLFDFDNSLP